MASTPIETWTGVRRYQNGGRPFAREMAWRALLATLAVALCYCFQWEWLRRLTADANLWLDSLAGVHLQRLSFDTVTWNGQLYRYAIACTFADVWCGSLAFLWRIDLSVSRNLALIWIWSALLFAFNVFRLSVSDILFAQGLSWNLAHNVVSGLSYFVVWQVLWSGLQRGRTTIQPTFSRIPVENM